MDISSNKDLEVRSQPDIHLARKESELLKDLANSVSENEEHPQRSLLDQYKVYSISAV